VLSVVKLGGAQVGDARGLGALVHHLVALPGQTVVVHGGGGEISAWQERMSLPVTWHEGLRVTTPVGLQVTAMVLSGWMNKRVVQAFEDAGIRAVGISGEDGSLITAARAHEGALGEVGTVVHVRPDLLEALLGSGFVPVVSPVSRGPDGPPLNVNADEAALHVAAAIGADRIYLVSDVPGVMRDGVVVKELSLSEARALIADGVAKGGMLVKIRQALVAAEAGVEVAIGDASILQDFTAGTILHGADEPAGVS
jgi:acetylglutamate kinase